MADSSPTPPAPDSPEAAVLAAIERGAGHYFDHCRHRIPGFVKQHFRYPGAWHTNKSAWGWDLVRAPINLFWAPFYVTALLLALVFQLLKLDAIARLLSAVPSGMTTSVQRKIAELVHRDLLQRPFDATRIDILDGYIVGELEKIAGAGSDREKISRQLAPVVNDALHQYAITRTASADITNSLLSTLTGAFAFQKFTPGGFAIGFTIAALISREWHESRFFLGDFLGGIYYSLFPPEPALSTILASIALILVLLAIMSSLSGLLTDPLQSWTGIHQRRLRKMIDKLEEDFSHNKSGGFRPKDQYLARILEITDAAKAQFL